jgi:hypothetical protein
MGGHTCGRLTGGERQRGEREEGWRGSQGGRGGGRR